jgi:hypothetical protein
MRDLPTWLPTLEDIHPHAWEVMAEAVDRFLNELDQLDDPAAPQRSGLAAGAETRPAPNSARPH